MIVENMDDTEGEAADIFSRVRKRRKRKILETDPSKTTQPAFGMLQKVLAIQSVLLNTTPQVASHGKITVPNLCLRVSLHPHKIGLILIEEVREILNQYSSFTIVDSPLSYIGVLFPTTKHITVEVPRRLDLNFIANVPIGVLPKLFRQELLSEDWMKIRLSKWYYDKPSTLLILILKILQYI